MFQPNFLFDCFQEFLNTLQIGFSTLIKRRGKMQCKNCLKPLRIVFKTSNATLHKNNTTQWSKKHLKINSHCSLGHFSHIKVLCIFFIKVLCINLSFEVLAFCTLQFLRDWPRKKWRKNRKSDKGTKYEGKTIKQKEIARNS